MNPLKYQVCVNDIYESTGSITSLKTPIDSLTKQRMTALMHCCGSFINN